MWLEIFYSGNHADSSGISQEYTASHLQSIADTYNSRISTHPQVKAPLVKGHPKHDQPAYGWVEQLARRGEKLYANLGNLSNEIINDIQSGRYKRLSVSFYPNKFLRHVGLLGAAQPALKDLPEIGFSQELDYSHFEIDVNPDEKNTSDNDKLNSTIEKDPNQSNYTIHDPLQNSKDISYQALLDENQALKQRINQIERESKRKEFQNYAESLLNNPNGPLISPSEIDDFVNMLEIADKIDFAEQNNNQPALKLIKKFYSSRQPLIASGAMPYPSANSVQNSSTNYSPQRLQLHSRAKSIMSEQPNISYEAALAQAMK